MDSYRTYRHSTDTARVRIVVYFDCKSAYRHEYCIGQLCTAARSSRNLGIFKGKDGKNYIKLEILGAI